MKAKHFIDAIANIPLDWRVRLQKWAHTESDNNEQGCMVWPTLVDLISVNMIVDDENETYKVILVEADIDDYPIKTDNHVLENPEYNLEFFLKLEDKEIPLRWEMGDWGWSDKIINIDFEEV